MFNSHRARVVRVRRTSRFHGIRGYGPYPSAEHVAIGNVILRLPVPPADFFFTFSSFAFVFGRKDQACGWGLPLALAPVSPTRFPFSFCVVSDFEWEIPGF